MVWLDPTTSAGGRWPPCGDSAARPAGLCRSRSRTHPHGRTHRRRPAPGRAGRQSERRPCGVAAAAERTDRRAEGSSGPGRCRQDATGRGRHAVERYSNTYTCTVHQNSEHETSSKIGTVGAPALRRPAVPRRPASRHRLCVCVYVCVVLCCEKISHTRSLSRNQPEQHIPFGDNATRAQRWRRRAASRRCDLTCDLCPAASRPPGM